MTDMTPSQAAQQNNRDGAGRYAPKAHAESGVDITAAATAEDRYTEMSSEMRRLEVERHDLIVDALAERVSELYPDARYLTIWKDSGDGYYPGTALTEWCDDVANTDEANGDADLRRWTSRIDPYNYYPFAKHLADEETTDRAVEAARLDFLGCTVHVLDLQRSS